MNLDCRHIEVPFWQPWSTGDALPADGLLILLVDIRRITESQWTAFHELLNAQEDRRRLRYRDAWRQRSFTAGRALLRQILGAHLGLPAQHVRLDQPTGQKLRLSNTPNLSFNLSRTTYHLALVFNFQDQRRLGIDLETCDREVEQAPIARQYFSAGEQHSLSVASKNTALFFHYWTRREALLKALGTGLVDEMNLLDLREGVRSVRFGGADAFRIRTIELEDLVLSLAMEGMAHLPEVSWRVWR